MAYLGMSPVVPDGVEPSFPGCDPSVVAVGPRDRVGEWTHPESHRDFQRAELASSCWTMSPSFRSGSRGTRTHKSLWRPPVFKTGSSSSRMTSVTSCGSWNRTNGLLVQSQASLPTATIPHRLFSSGGRNRTYGLLVQSQASLPTATTPECGECPAGIEPASPAWKAGASADRPRAHVVKRKGRESNPQGREARPGSSGVPSPVGLPFRFLKAPVGGIEPPIIGLTGRRLTIWPHRIM